MGLHSFIQDYITAGGICEGTVLYDFSVNTGPPDFKPFYPTTSDCDVTINMILKPSEYYNQNFTFNDTTINKGICSLNTAEKLNTTECAKQMVTQPDLILNTINNLMECMYTLEEIIPLESLVLELEYPSVRIPRGLKNSKKIKTKKRKKTQKKAGKKKKKKKKKKKS